MSEHPDHDRTRLMLLDDHGLFRASLARFLGSLPDFDVAAECGTSAEALRVLEESAVDLILLDFDLGPEGGNEFISAARQSGYRGSFLVVAGTAEPRSVAIALKQGASGIFLKSEAPERLVRAIQSIASGEVWIDPKVVQMLADRLTDPYLNFKEESASVLEDRERNVLLGILSGLTNRSIGENLGLSESSVKNVVQRLFGKAGVKTRGQLVRAALEGSLGATCRLIERQRVMAADQRGSNRPPRTPTVANPSPLAQSYG